MRTIKDTLNRSMRDLRISVTDRCNFRCSYCMPKEVFNSSYQFLARSELLSFEEIVRVTRIFAALGVKKVRLTGGEPLVRKYVERLIEKIALIPDIEDISLTTNGSLLTLEKMRLLSEAGLQRITISLDTLDEEIFQTLNGVSYSVTKVLAGIEHAATVMPVKINMVVKRGVNDKDIVPMAEYFRHKGHILRFIEYMDVGTTNSWQMDEVVSGTEIVDMINQVFPLQAVAANYAGEVANRWRYRDGSGEIGIISSVTEPFCHSCSRMRLSANGNLYLCLFANHGYDIRNLLRQAATDEYILNWIKSLWEKRDDRYSETRSSQTGNLKKVEMSFIGG